MIKHTHHGGYVIVAGAVAYAFIGAQPVGKVQGDVFRKIRQFGVDNIRKIEVFFQSVYVRSVGSYGTFFHHLTAKGQKQLHGGQNQHICLGGFASAMLGGVHEAVVVYQQLPYNIGRNGVVIEPFLLGGIVYDYSFAF